jgi:hypothetical protein
LITVSIIVVLAGAWLSAGEPRLTIVNAGISVTYPWARGLGALAAAAAFVGLLTLISKFWVRVASGLLAMLSLWVGLHLLTYRVDTTTSGLASRSHLVKREIAWRDVTDVGMEVGFIVLAAKDSKKIEIDTTDFTVDQRLALNRTIVRRVSEVQNGPYTH